MASSNKTILPGWLTRISGKIYAIVALAAIGIGAIMAQSLYTIRVDLTETKSRELQHLVETAVSTVSSFHKQAKAGLITQEKAQQQARLAISKLRYDGKHYFWINDTELKMVMHPFEPKLNGQNVGHVTDPNGMQLFVEFSNVAKAQGGGIVNYMWPRPGTNQPQPKIAYVSHFAPWGWVIGTGTYIDDLDALFFKDVSSLLTVSLAVFAVIMMVSLLLARSLVTPIKGVIKSMLDIAAGRTNTEVPSTNRMDEIGQMAQAVLVFRRNASERQAMEEQETARKAAQEKERRALLVGMAGEFDANIRTILTSVNEASHLLSQQSDKMANQANENSGHVGTISSAMQQTSLNVEAVAGASEEMSASIAEISNQVGESARFSQNAVDEVKRANTVVSGLSDASQAIGRIVNLIQDIAEQTNLLALNATIEAARAGDAGKGFAVVASEVKGLASQTGKATEEIADQINTIQSAISDAVVAIDHVDDTIQKLSEISGVISIAVEEQGMAAAEISSNITQAAMGSRDVSDNTEKLHSLATDNGESAAAMSNETHRLQEQLNQLSKQVDYFIDGIQNGQSNAA